MILDIFLKQLQNLKESENQAGVKTKVSYVTKICLNLKCKLQASLST